MLILCLFGIHISTRTPKLLSVSLVQERNKCTLLLFLIKFISLEKFCLDETWKIAYEIDIEEILMEEVDSYGCGEVFEIVKKAGSITLFTLLKKLSVTKKVFKSPQVEKNILKFKVSVLIDKDKNLVDLRGNLGEIPTETRKTISDKIKKLMSSDILHIKSIPELTSSFRNSNWKLDYIIGFVEKEGEQDFILYLNFSLASEPIGYLILNFDQKDSVCDKIENTETKHAVLKEAANLKCSPTAIEYKKLELN